MLVEAGLNICITPNQINISNGARKGGTERRHFLAPVGCQERNEHYKRQKILGKVDRHVVAKEFPREVLKQQPA
jgi:hypothetical protein